MTPREEGPEHDAPKVDRPAGDRPVPPGLLLRQKYFDHSGMSEEELARRLGVSRTTLSRIFNVHRRISASTATKLWKAFGENPAEWIALQRRYDEWVRLDRQRRPPGRPPDHPKAPPRQRPPRPTNGGR